MYFSLKPASNFVAAALALAIPLAAWPYLAAVAILAIGLPVAIRNQRRHADLTSELVEFGPLLFAIPMAIFAADHFTGARFVATAVPSWMPWHLFWTYFVGVALIAAAVSLASNKLAGLAAALLGIMIFLFVLMIHVPGCFATPFDKTRVAILFRDLALSAAALAFAAARAEDWRSPSLQSVVTAARFVIGVTLVLFGIDHFLNATFAPGIPQENAAIFVTMPAWIPGHAVWAYVTGAILVVCALAIITGKQARLAAIAVALTLLVLIVFVYLPLTIAKASDIANGLNYLAIHFALAGAALMLASALPSQAPESVKVVAVTET